MLRTLDETVLTRGITERDNFAFNALVNAFSTVLERIRTTQPEQFGTYREMVQLMLRDDP